MKRLAFTFEVIAPFKGVVDRVFFQQGDWVKEGDPIISLRANGAVHDILAPLTGYAENMEVGPGDFVLSGMILASITETSKPNITD